MAPSSPSTAAAAAATKAPIPSWPRPWWPPPLSSFLLLLQAAPSIAAAAFSSLPPPQPRSRLTEWGRTVLPRPALAAALAAARTDAPRPSSRAAGGEGKSKYRGGRRGKSKSRGHRGSEDVARRRGRPDGRRPPPSSSRSRPFADLTWGELKQLTEYHLSQNIRPGPSSDGGGAGALSLGTMSPAQMHEFSRLISGWAKLHPAPRPGSPSSPSLSSEARRRRTQAAEMAEQCLRELVEEKRAGNAGVDAILTPDAYHLVIRAWLGVGGHRDLVHAASLLDLMEEIHFPGEGGEIGEALAESSMKCYAAVLDGWCKSRASGSERRAEEMLRRMGRADVRHYNNVINRIAAGGRRDCGEEAERLLREMIDSHRRAGGNETKGADDGDGPGRAMGRVSPNRNSFNAVIKAYANSGTGDSPSNAERVLSMMEDPTSVGLGDLARELAPDRISYTTVLVSRVNSAGGEGCRVDEGERAEGMLERMERMRRAGRSDLEPDTVMYNAILKVWGKCDHPDAGERSEALLIKMLRLHEEGNTNVAPDDVTFNTVIHNIANSGDLDSTNRAMELLEQMEKFHESGLIKAKPNAITHNSVLNAFAKCGGSESAYRAEKMLDNLERAYDSGMSDVFPDTYAYNIVINAWGNCGQANRAVALLDRMTTLTKKGEVDVKPDVTTYNSVLHAWSQSTDRNAPVKALGLLEIMLRLHEGGDMRAQPDVASFSTVIDAFAKSRFPRKARQTRDLLTRMKRLYEAGQKNIRPNIFVYAAVLNACAYTFGRPQEMKEALKIGIDTYEELQASPEVNANHVAYGSFIKLCRRLIQDDSRRDHLITRAFHQCCSDGQLGEYMLKQLHAVPQLYASLLQGYVSDGEALHRDLPLEWTCNVRGRRKRTRQPIRKR